MKNIFKQSNIRNKQVVVSLFVIGLILMVVGISYAMYTFTGTGTKENVITTGQITVEFAEQNNILIQNRYPETDTVGIASTDEKSQMTFTVSSNIAGVATVNYAVGLAEIEEGATLTEDYIKINLTKNGSAATGFTTTTGNTIKSFENETFSDLIPSHVIARGTVSGTQTDTYTLKAWIHEDYNLPTTDTSSGKVHSSTTTSEEFSFKIKVAGTDATQNEEEPNIPNAPELATNMIPVTYDGENWVKADSTNSNNSWYNYDNKVWANAVTVTEVDNSRSDLVDAPVGTPIPMERINTMWVWIPRFNATIDGTFCSDIENVNIEDYPGCYNNKIIINESYKAELINDLTFVSILNPEFNAENVINAAINNNDITTMDSLLKQNSQFKIFQHFSDAIILSDEDRAIIFGAFGEEMGQMIIDSRLTSAILALIVLDDPNVDITLTSNITFSETDDVIKKVCNDEGKTENECKLFVNQLNESDNKTKISYIYEISSNESAIEYFWPEEENIKYETYLAENNVIENNKEKDESDYKCYDSELLIQNEYNNRVSCEEAGHKWRDTNAEAINVRFTKNSENSHDAFTFGEEMLSGLWVAKFNISHTTLSESTIDNNLECENEICTNAKAIEILPNKVKLRYQNVSNMFYASRSMEQDGNNYGLVSNEVDTHMMKSSEWGAVSYLTHSVYGRCSSSTSCTFIEINDHFITGYVDDTSKEGSYETVLGMDASTTGNIYGIYDMNSSVGEYVMGVYTDGNKLWSGSDESTNSGFNGCLGENCEAEKSDGLSFPNTKYYNVYTTEDEYINARFQHSMGEMPWSYGTFFVEDINPWVVHHGIFRFALVDSSSTGGMSYYNISFRAVLVK